jgi:heme/copper-type cytochrome/quinol oxidase subunit 3
LGGAVTQATLSGPRIEPARLALWVFLASEALLFAGLIGGYLFLATARGYSGHQGALSVPMAGAATGLLVASSVCAVQLERPNGRSARLRWWLATLLLGAAFLGLQAHEYQLLLEAGIAPKTSLYWSGFFLLTAVHGLHVFIGLVALFWFGSDAVRVGQAGLKLELACVYWHFVDVVWILLFVLLYLA